MRILTLIYHTSHGGMDFSEIFIYLFHIIKMCWGTEGRPVNLVSI